MKKTFIGITYNKMAGGSYYFGHELVLEIVDGIQERGGEIINVMLTPVGNGGCNEHLLVFYEDNNNYSQIKPFLDKYIHTEYKGLKKIWDI